MRQIDARCSRAYDASTGRNSGQLRKKLSPWAGPCMFITWEVIVDKHEAYLKMRLKIEAVFEHYAAQSEYYKRANIAQRFAMEDAFYRLTMELLGRIIGPFQI
jgi:hypothetical protein